METSEAVKYCSRCGTALNRVQSFGKLRPVCPQCGWIYFADPKVAAAVLVEEDGRILMVRRSNEPFRGSWSLPAGFIDAGEDPALAACRECLEETGLTVQIDRVLDVVAGLEHERGADFIIVYQARIVSGEIKPGDDADDVQWFLKSDLPPLAFKTTEKMLNARM